MITDFGTHSPAVAASPPLALEVRLLERVRDRTDAGAWAEFVGLYQPVLRVFVRRHGVREADIQDVVQEILAQLVPALTRFEFDPDRGRFRTWLWRVTGNAAANWSRKRTSRARAETVWCRDRPLEMTEPDPADEPEPAQLRKVLPILAEVRAATGPTTWACFEGQVLHGRTAVELASELGVSRNTVYVNTCRVRARIRQRYTDPPAPAEGDAVTDRNRRR